MGQRILNVLIHTDSAAFDGESEAVECSLILRSIADKISTGEATGDWQTILDTNGNDCGRWKLGD